MCVCTRVHTHQSYLYNKDNNFYNSCIYVYIIWIIQFIKIYKFIRFYLIIVPLQQQVVGELEPPSGSLEHLVPPFRLTESGNGTNGFMLVGDSGETESLSHHLKVCKTFYKVIIVSNVLYK